MPKIVNEEERRLTKEAIFHSTIQLIKEKGVRTITVDDITEAVGIGKGSFYAYYPSKEAWLYEVIKRCEREIFMRMEEHMETIRSDKERAVRLLESIYTDEDSLMPYVSQQDVEMLLRKLPAEYHEMERQKSERNFQTALQMMNLEHSQMEVVAVLIDSLSFAASNKEYSRYGTKEALHIMIHALADYVAGGEENE